MGFPHPDYLLQVLTAKQMVEWEIFDKIEPIGEFRSDYRMAALCSVNTNLAIKVNSKSKNPKLTTPLDFMPNWKGEKHKIVKKQSPEEMKQLLLGMASAQNSKVRKEKSLHNNKPKQRR